MRERRNGKTQEQAAAKADLLDRKTAAKYEVAGTLPSEMVKPRGYRTRVDPFESDWERVVELLTDAPELEALTLFDWLCERRPGKYQAGQVRTFQRRLRAWRIQHVDKLLTLPQIRKPGELMQTDGCWMARFGVTIAGEPFPHMLIHSVLPYSNWEWGRVTQSESLMAIWLGLRSAIEKLGKLPAAHQTDNSTGATHRLSARDRELSRQERGHNETYAALLRELDVEARTTHRQSPNENGDAEALHGAFGRALEQHLLLRGSRDFESIAAYEAFLVSIFERRNAMRTQRLAEELAVMRPLPSSLSPAIRECRPVVSGAGTVRVMKRTYSLPSGYAGETVRARVSEWEIQFWHGHTLIQTRPRRTGVGDFDINYRHVIDTVLRKPGGFRNYRYFEALFPSSSFRRAWESLCARMSPRRADLAYLRILNLAAKGVEADVAAMLTALLLGDDKWDDETVKAAMRPVAAPIPVVLLGAVDLKAYDQLLALEVSR